MFRQLTRRLRVSLFTRCNSDLTTTSSSQPRIDDLLKIRAELEGDTLRRVKTLEVLEKEFTERNANPPQVQPSKVDPYLLPAILGVVAILALTSYKSQGRYNAQVEEARAKAAKSHERISAVEVIARTAPDRIKATGERLGLSAAIIERLQSAAAPPVVIDSGELKKTVW
eukprot:TRINITY_DN13995_c0_g1_i1.p1 TRINITY_DN13995_c0_g1~~TRINITY_DN13995_c0_g1_i1.p1  ORF type:complete len:170 (+),score=17.66 TRINITY_DN13995_c0_g1_i1:20-529(+)